MPLVAQICMVVVTIALVGRLLDAFSHTTRSARAGVSRFEGLATRSSALASDLLNEVERPISQVAGMIRRIRSGANYLVQRWQSRGRGRELS